MHVGMQAAKLASVRLLQTERSVTRGIEMANLHTFGSSTDRLHRAMAAMQSPRSQTAHVRLHRSPARDSRTSMPSMNRRLDTYSTTPILMMKEVLYTPRRSESVRRLLDPKVRHLSTTLTSRSWCLTCARCMCLAVQLLANTRDQAALCMEAAADHAVLPSVNS